MKPLNKNNWSSLRIGITGASGSLGQALTKAFKEKGAFVIGITSNSTLNKETSLISPDEWVQWSCGQESLLNKTLKDINILVLNHGINLQGLQSNKDIDKSLEVNALSTWRLIESFENLVNNERDDCKIRELWINTSEAEIQPAFSPTYEISKRLIGEIVSIRKNNSY